MNYKKIAHIQQEPFTFSILPIGSWECLSKMLGKEIGLIEVIYINGDIYLSNADLEKIEKIILSNPEKIKEFLAMIDKHNKEFIYFCENHKTKDNLSESFSEFMNLYKNFGANAVIMIVLEKIIKSRLEDELFNHFGNIDADEFKRIVSILSMNIKESATIKERKELLKMALQIPMEKLSESAELKNHLDKYSWLNSKFLKFSPYKPEDIIERIRNISDASEELAHMEENVEKLGRELNKLTESIKSNTNLCEAVKDMQEICFLRTNRVEAINYGCFKIYWLFEKIAGKLNLSPENIPFLLYNEIAEALQGKIIMNFKDRLAGYALIAKDGNIKILTGNLMSDFQKKFEAPVEKREIRGVIASHGIAQGRVKIIMNKNEISKLNKGEILVTPMTTPDFVIAMEKAAAIITDIGGLTSHAAIISREMNIPCIVGTDVATQLLKDEDFVVVDAVEKGEVVKIDRKRFGLEKSD